MLSEVASGAESGRSANAKRPLNEWERRVDVKQRSGSWIMLPTGSAMYGRRG